MSKILQQIQALQVKQKKIDYIIYILDLLNNDSKCVDFKDVQSDVLKLVDPFLRKLSESIENETPLEQSATSIFTEGEVRLLKMITAKAAQKRSEPPTSITQNNPYENEETAPKLTPKKPESSQDKLSFALSNRHLADKQVRVENHQNMNITGKVVGLDAPNVVVKTDNGPTISVPLERISLV